MSHSFSLLTLIAVFFSFQVFGQKEGENNVKPSDVIHWEIVRWEAPQADATVIVVVRLATEGGFSLYKEKITFSNDQGYLLTNTEYPPSKTQIDPLTNHSTDVLRGGEFKLTFKGMEAFTKDSFALAIRYIGCTNLICLFPHTETLQVSLRNQPQTAVHSTTLEDVLKAETPVLGNEIQPVENESEKTTVATISEPEAKSSASSISPFEERLASKLQSADISMLLLLLIALVGGLLTNLTPCVYPMIGITVRLLAKRSSSPLISSSIYSAGIILSYTTLGLITAYSGALFGQLMASPLLNFFLGLLMFFLALSLSDSALFSFFQNMGNNLGKGKRGLKAVFLMGVGAGLVAAPCTGPILAALLTYASVSQSIFKAVAVLFFYSLGFALPYLVLGQTAAKVVKIKVNPKIQLTIKTIFSGIIAALGCYYLRIPFYGFYKELATLWPILIGCFGMMFLLSLAIKKKWAPSLGTLYLGIFLFSAFEYTLEKQKMLTAKADIVWLYDEKAAFETARGVGSPVLIDVWAEWCESCKKMDLTTFKDPKVREELLKEEWTLLKIDFTKSTPANDEIQKRYRIKGLPALVFLKNPKDHKEFQSLEGFTHSERLLSTLSSLKNKKRE